MAKAKPDSTVDADTLRNRVRDLESQLAAAGSAALDTAPVQAYPAVKYRKALITPRTPNGYEVRRVADEAEAARLPAGWVDTPDDI